MRSSGYFNDVMCYVILIYSPDSFWNMCFYDLCGYWQRRAAPFVTVTSLITATKVCSLGRCRRLEALQLVQHHMKCTRCDDRSTCFSYLRIAWIYWPQKYSKIPQKSIQTSSFESALNGVKTVPERHLGAVINTKVDMNGDCCKQRIGDLYSYHANRIIRYCSLYYTGGDNSSRTSRRIMIKSWL